MTCCGLRSERRNLNLHKEGACKNARLSELGALRDEVEGVECARHRSLYRRGPR